MTTRPAATLATSVTRDGDADEARAGAGVASVAGKGVVRVSSAACASACANSAADANRSAGTRAIARATMASVAGVTAGRVALMGRGVSVIARVRMAAEVGPANGGSPTSIS